MCEALGRLFLISAFAFVVVYRLSYNSTTRFYSLMSLYRLYNVIQYEVTCLFATNWLLGESEKRTRDLLIASPAWWT